MFQFDPIPDAQRIGETKTTGRKAASKERKASKPRAQHAALPFRINSEGRVEIMLITSRETKRWIVPKGWPIKGLEPYETAEREAFEEAGLHGHATKRPIGRYVYEKRLQHSSVMCEVSVHPLLVVTQRDRWPEQHQRDGRWFSVEGAATAVREAGLQQLIRSFGPAEAARVSARMLRRANKTVKKSNRAKERETPVATGK